MDSLESKMRLFVKELILDNDRRLCLRLFKIVIYNTILWGICQDRTFSLSGCPRNREIEGSPVRVAER